MTHDEQVQTALAALRGADDGLLASAAVESAVMDAFDRHHDARSNWSRWAAIAAMLTLAVGLSLFVAGRYGSGTRTADSEQRAAVGEPGAGVPEVTDFVAWPGAAMLPEFEGGQLVRTSLPVTVLPLLGIPPADAPGVDGYVTADVLYGQDGQPRAVRVVNKRLTP